jgi:SOS-response transcriptional repressor LexA
MISTNLNETKRQNLLRLMAEKNKRPVDIARLIERDPAYIAAILKPPNEKGARSIGPTILNALCDKLEVSEDEFYRGMGIPVPELQPKPIPVISWIHAGEFADAADHWPVGVSSEGDPVFSFVKTGPNAFGLRVQGDSMLPRFMPGDIAIIDPAIRCDNGAPCVVSLNGEASLKLFWDKETEIVLKSMNDKYPDMIIKKDSKADFRVIGKVVDIRAKF